MSHIAEPLHPIYAGPVDGTSIVQTLSDRDSLYPIYGQRCTVISEQKDYRWNGSSWQLDFVSISNLEEINQNQFLGRVSSSLGNVEKLTVNPDSVFGRIPTIGGGILTNLTWSQVKNHIMPNLAEVVNQGNETLDSVGVNFLYTTTNNSDHTAILSSQSDGDSVLGHNVYSDGSSFLAFKTGLGSVIRFNEDTYTIAFSTQSETEGSPFTMVDEFIFTKGGSLRLRNLDNAISNLAILSNNGTIENWNLATLTEVSYLSGVTSSIQTQLDNKSNVGHSHVLNDITDRNLITLDYVATNGNNTNLSLVIGGLTFSGNLIPDVDISYDLGSSAKRLRAIYTQRLESGGYLENNLEEPSIQRCPNGTVLVYRNGKLVPSYKENDLNVLGVSMEGLSKPVIMGVEKIRTTGSVKEGDFLTTSNKTGRAQSVKKYKPGSVIAQALEDSEGNGLIKAYIFKM